MKHTLFHQFFSFFIGVLATCCWACSDDSTEGGESAHVFEIKDEYLKQDFTKEQQSIKIPVVTQVQDEAWSVLSDQPWCLVTKGYDGDTKAIILFVQTSEEPEVRTATVTAKSSIKNYTINVRQLGYGPAILIKEANISVEPDGGPVNIVVTSNIEFTVTRSENSDWITESPASRGMVEYPYNYTVAANPYYEPRSCTFTYNYENADKDISATCTVSQKAKASSISDVEAEGDTKVIPTRGEDNDHQNGNDISKTFDGEINNGAPYHSTWNQKANFPVRLEYFFEDNTKDRDIDYIIYHTRSGNGNFGKFDLYVATESEPDYKLLGSYDFNGQNADSKISFKERKRNVTKIKFLVHSGLGDFVSCDEMEFFKKRDGANEEEQQLLTVFKDLTCSELNDDVTTESIYALPSYFANIAVQLKNNTYDEWEKEFRIRDYEAYSIPEVWAEKLMTKKYTNLDNTTGIYVGDQTEIVVLVGDTYGQNVSIQSVAEETSGGYLQTAASGETHFLKEGINKITFSKGGMLYIMYNTDLSSKPKPIKVHIPLGSGTVNGFFDLKEHQTNAKYQEYINKATYKYFCVRGEKIIFYFHTDKMKKAVPEDILSAINLWDDIIGWQQELMGIEDVRPSLVNNHIFAISPEGSYMWASDYRIGFVYTYLDNILLRENVMAAKDNAWGPAHEIGHIHQKAINWPSSTESSNNLFSNFVLYKLGKYCSRGSELSALAMSRFVNKRAWYNMGSATHQNEDTEVHMRMNWQLWNYYHRCGYKTDFWQTLFKLLRETRIEESDPGAGQLLFAKMASKAANQNLTEFFDMWGFFKPVDNVAIEQYGNWNYNVTQSMINSAKTYMAQFPAPKHAFYYLEDRKNGDVGIENYKVGDVGYYTAFKNNVQITKNIGVSVSGQTVRITNGDEAVAFELREGGENGTLLYFSNFFEFEVPSSIPITSNVKVYAVQADGKRIRL